jgi:polyhydroxyalkanoate synthesis regulator phasin
MSGMVNSNPSSVAEAKALLQSAEKILSDALTTIKTQLAKAQAGLDDKKTREIIDIVKDASKALQKPMSELKAGTEKLTALESSLSEYYETDFNSFDNSGENVNNESSSGGSSVISYGEALDAEEMPDDVFVNQSNLDAKGLSVEERVALGQYSGDGHFSINSYLRNGGGDMSPYQQQVCSERAAAISGALNGRFLADDTQLYRGMTDTTSIFGADWQNCTPEELNARCSGQIVTDRGFMSTSTNRDTAAQFAQSWNGTILNITAPAGTQGMCMGAVSS